MQNFSKVYNQFLESKFTDNENKQLINSKSDLVLIL